MGKGQSPSALDNYLLNNRHDEVYNLSSTSDRIESRADIMGISVDEAASQIKYMDTHGGSLYGYQGK